MTTGANMLSFEPDSASPAEWARMYRACGLQVVPARYPMRAPEDKRPALAGWLEFQNEIVSETRFEAWFPPNCKSNMGVITGRASGGLLVIDLDDYKGGSSGEWWRSVTSGIEPETPVQITGGGGRQYLFRIPAGVEISSHRTPIADIRCQGGFAMLPPSLHMSGKEYTWAKHRGPWECDIAEAPRDLIEAVIELIESHRGTVGHGAVERVASSGDFDAFGNLVDGRETYMRDLIWAAVLNLYRKTKGVRDGDAEAEAFQTALDVYLNKVKTRIPGVPNIEGLDREGRGPTLFHLKWRAELKKWDGKVAQEAAKPSPRPFDGPSAASQFQQAGDEPGMGVETPARKLTLKPAFPINAAAIEPRAWVIPGLLIRRHLSVLVAPPGSGKSLFTLQIGVAAAALRTWGGFVVRKPAKVLVINAEDDTDEMQRRLWAAADEMKVLHASLAGRIFLAEEPEGIVIAKTDAKTKGVIRLPLVDELISLVNENGIDVLVVDPFAETFEGDENSNSEVKWAGIYWREIARRTNCAVLLVHHTRKYAGGMAGDADASRGGSALVGTARIVSTLFGMTEDEARLMNVAPDKRSSFVRFDDAKANLSLVTGQARWFEKVTKILPNGTIETPGDHVGVLSPWTPPGVMDGVSLTQIGYALDAIDDGVLDENGRQTGVLFSPDIRSRDRWVGKVIESHCRLPQDEEHARAKTIIKEWLKSGLLYEVETTTPSREKKVGLKVDQTRRPDRRVQ